MTVSHIIRNGVLYEASKAPRKAEAPSVITDTMDAMMHHAIGRPVDSKSAFRRITRDHGYEEVGNEQQKVSKPETPDQVYRDHVEKAMAEVECGRRSDGPRREGAPMILPPIEREAIERSLYEIRNGRG